MTAPGARFAPPVAATTLPHGVSAQQGGAHRRRPGARRPHRQLLLPHHASSGPALHILRAPGGRARPRHRRTRTTRDSHRMHYTANTTLRGRFPTGALSAADRGPFRFHPSGRGRLPHRPLVPGLARHRPTPEARDAAADGDHALRGPAAGSAGRPGAHPRPPAHPLRHSRRPAGAVAHKGTVDAPHASRARGGALCHPLLPSACRSIAPARRRPAPPLSRRSPACRPRPGAAPGLVPTRSACRR